jgi:pSer/pThr/pTyr-binding forkhead associated (FHA) protein
LVSFATSASLELDLTNDFEAARNAISVLRDGGGTNMGDGIEQGNQVLLTSVNPSSNLIMFLLSDGIVEDGLSPPEILTGPVTESANAGICINTIGFGNAGDIDEELLAEIAARTNCTYSYADVDESVLILDNTFIRNTHTINNNIIYESGGNIAPGQTAPPQPFSVPEYSSQLMMTLNWPDGELDLNLLDPSGQPFDLSQPGVQLNRYAGLLYLAIPNPTAGQWQALVGGAPTLPDLTPYNLIFSVLPSVLPTPRLAAPPQVVVETRTPWPWMLGLGVVLLAALGFMMVMISRNKQDSAGVQLIDGQAKPPWAALRNGQLYLGRAEGNGVVIYDDQASNNHAHIEKVAQGYLLHDLNSSNGTLVNGQRVNRQLLQAGDIIQIGTTQFRFAAVLEAARVGHGQPSPANVPMGARPPSSTNIGVRVISGTAAPSWAGLRQGQLQIGRDGANDLVVTDEQTSRFHARISQTPSAYVIEDLNSANGTYVNGQRISQPTHLNNGDMLKIGDAELRFETT